MPWREDILYAPNTPKLRAALEAHEVLGPQLCVIPSSAVPRSTLPPGGLLAVRSLMPPEAIKHADGVPWDALHCPPTQALRLPEPSESPETPSWTWPPQEALRHLAALADATQTPIAYHRGETFGGTAEHEVTWVLGDRHVLVTGVKGGASVRADLHHKVIPQDALLVGLSEIGVEMISGYFEPHTGQFDWDACRLHPRAPKGEALPPQPQSLHRCAALGDLEGVRRLLERGADPNAYSQNAPLSLAAAGGHLAMLELLLTHGAEIGDRGHNPLIVAQTAEVAAALIQHGAPLTGPVSPLVSAARRGRAEVFEQLVTAGAPLDYQAKDWALWFACCAGGLQARALEGLAAGVAIDARVAGPFMRRSGLELACRGGHYALAMRLIELGATPTEATVVGAASGGHLELLSALLDRGGSPESREHDETALCGAARAGELPCVARLLEAGANPNTKSIGERTALHGAAQSGHLPLITCLLEAGAELEARSGSGYTPLWTAVGSGRQEVVDHLLAHGANREVVNEWGTPLRELTAQRDIVLDAAT